MSEAGAVAMSAYVWPRPVPPPAVAARPSTSLHELPHAITQDGERDLLAIGLPAQQ